jgi:hypothetical protein
MINKLQYASLNLIQPPEKIKELEDQPLLDKELKNVYKAKWNNSSFSENNYLINFKVNNFLGRVSFCSIAF